MGIPFSSAAVNTATEGYMFPVRMMTLGIVSNAVRMRSVRSPPVMKAQPTLLLSQVKADSGVIAPTR